jgi:hypothetical protein
MNTKQTLADYQNSPLSHPSCSPLSQTHLTLSRVIQIADYCEFIETIIHEHVNSTLEWATVADIQAHEAYLLSRKIFDQAELAESMVNLTSEYNETSSILITGAGMAEAEQLTYLFELANRHCMRAYRAAANAGQIAARMLHLHLATEAELTDALQTYELFKKAIHLSQNIIKNARINTCSDGSPAADVIYGQWNQIESEVLKLKRETAETLRNLEKSGTFKF